MLPQPLPDHGRSAARRSTCWLSSLLALTLMLALPGPAAAQTPATAEPAISAQAAILVDLSSGQVLFNREAHTRRAVASLTKVMTAVVALQHGRLTDEVVIEARDLPGEASIGLKVGDRVTLETLLYGMLMRSGNDAAAAIARGVGERVVAERGLRGGGQAVFINLMNQQAAGLGMTNTQFLNPHGLDAPGHVSSAYDLALLTQHALRDQTFARMFGARTHPAHGGTTWTNSNRLLHSFEPLIGGKTGVTDEAGLCLIEVAQRGDRRLLVVVLDAPQWYTDAQALLEYGFGGGRGAAGPEPFGAASPPSGPVFLSAAATPAASPPAGSQSGSALLGLAATVAPRLVPTPTAATSTRLPVGGGASGGIAGPATDQTVRAIAAPAEAQTWQGATVALQTGADGGAGWLPLGIGILVLVLVLALVAVWLRMTGVRPWQRRWSPSEAERRPRPWERQEPASLLSDDEADDDEAFEADELEADEVAVPPVTGRLDDLAPAGAEEPARPGAAVERSLPPAPESRSETDELAVAHLAVAVRYVGEGRLDAAESAFMKAIQIAPHFRFSSVPLFWSMGADGYVVLASAYQRLNRPVDARATVAMGLIAFPNHPRLTVLDEQGQRERRSARSAAGD